MNPRYKRDATSAIAGAAIIVHQLLAREARGLVGLRVRRGQCSWQQVMLDDDIVVREWLADPSMADAVVIDLRQPGEVVFVHPDVLCRFRVARDGEMIVVSDVALDGAAANPELEAALVGRLAGRKTMRMA
jgi:predicted transcriptional regulator